MAAATPQLSLHLVLFLSRATPLARWDRIGILQREIALYQQLTPHLKKISIVTSGGREELAHQSLLPGVAILYNRWGLSPNLYSVLAPLLHRGVLQTADLYKTNQFDGGWTAVIAGKLYQKPVIVRAGYLWAEFNRAEGAKRLKLALMDRLQAYMIRRATHLLLTTENMKADVQAAYGVAPAQISVLPNFVDTSVWRPDPESVPESATICYVGRFHPRKNLDLLIEAVGRLPGSRLVLIGDGVLREALARLCQQHGVSVTFPGRVPNHELPAYINRSTLFVLPSQFEGHPKVLIEAMACGCPVVGADVPGINNVVLHEQTGLLCPPTVAGVQTAVSRLLADADLRHTLGANGRQFVLENYSLTQIVQRELTVYQQVMMHG